MLDLDKELMAFKIALRAISKPGDNLWDVIPEEGINGFIVSGSDIDENGNDCNFTVMYDIAMLKNTQLWVEYTAFDDESEWEFRLDEIIHNSKRIRY